MPGSPRLLRIVAAPLSCLIVAKLLSTGLHDLLFHVLIPWLRVPLPQDGNFTGHALVVMTGIEWARVAIALAILLGVGLLLERKRLPELGLTRVNALPQLGVGFGIGAALLTVVVAVMALAGWYRVQSVGPVGRDFALSLLLFLGGAVFEEVYFRGILFRLIEGCVGSWGAIAITAAYFGITHAGNPGASWHSSVGIMIAAGVLLAAAYLAFRSLWLPIGLHWAWNLFEGPVYGTPVSGEVLNPVLHATVHGPALWTGGIFGPEAGLVCMIVGGLTGAALMVWVIQRHNLYTPRWMQRLLGVAAPPAAPTAG